MHMVGCHEHTLMRITEWVSGLDEEGLEVSTRSTQVAMVVASSSQIHVMSAHVLGLKRGHGSSAFEKWARRSETSRPMPTNMRPGLSTQPCGVEAGRVGRTSSSLVPIRAVVAARAA